MHVHVSKKNHTNDQNKVHFDEWNYNKVKLSVQSNQSILFMFDLVL